MEAAEEMCFCSLERVYGLILKTDLLFLILSCQEAIDPISLILGRSGVFTILKGLEMFIGLLSQGIICRFLLG